MEFLSVSLQVSKPQDESTARRCYCPSDTARSVKVNPLRWLGGSPLTVLQTPRGGTKITSGTSTSCSQLFTVRASLGSSAPLLSPLLSWRAQVSSSSHSTFHFSLPLPPPQPLGMCRLYDSREIQRGGGGLASSVAPYFARPGRFVWSFSFTHCLVGKDPARLSLKPGERRLKHTGLSVRLSPGRKRLLSAVNFKVTGARGWRGWAGSGRGREGMNYTHTGKHTLMNQQKHHSVIIHVFPNFLTTRRAGSWTILWHD